MAAIGSRGLLKEVKVRMYRPGLGDCFLLTFRAQDGGGADGGEDIAGVYHMLIDCGVLQGSEGAADRMRKIAGDILQTTGCHLNTVVATHEHWDHVCGFRYAKNLFGLNPQKPPETPITVDQVWMAWTEDMEDEGANRLRARNLKMSLAITAALMGAAEAQAKPVREIMKFAGHYLDETPEVSAPNPPVPTLPRAGGYLNQIMAGLRSWGQASPRYLEPGEIIDLTNFGVKIYVLGPSRDLRQLGGGQERETRPGSPGLRMNQSTAFLAAAVKASGLELEEDEAGPLSKSDLDELFRLSLPFDESRSIQLEDAPSHPEYGAFFRANYGGGTGGRQGSDWRRIDADWLQMAETLALQQVSNVNNTSLVLAIELVESGQVLLFPADAELESWETWGCGDQPLDDLLRRTVFYKVGHHGSVNATLLQGGLDKMTHPDLVAVIPVDKVRAADNDWHFPEDKLYTELVRKTKGRVILNCEEPCLLCDPTYDDVLFAEGTVTKDSSPDKLWVEYTIPF